MIVSMMYNLVTTRIREANSLSSRKGIFSIFSAIRGLTSLIAWACRRSLFRVEWVCCAGSCI